MPPLPQALAEMAPRLAKLVAPVVEQVEQGLTKGQGTAARPLTVSTLLTQSNRSMGRNQVRTVPKGIFRPQKIEMPAGCRERGVVLEDRTRQYCDECLPEYRAEQSGSFSDAGRAKLKELREVGIDRSHTGKASAKRSKKMQQRRREELEWNAQQPTVKGDAAVFEQDILPKLQEFSLSQISAVTGLSQQYRSQVRRGLKVPHRRHWANLRCLSGPFK